jgi:hypothetical protein
VGLVATESQVFWLATQLSLHVAEHAAVGAIPEQDWLAGHADVPAT